MSPALHTSSHEPSRTVSTVSAAPLYVGGGILVLVALLLIVHWWRRRRVRLTIAAARRAMVNVEARQYALDALEQRLAGVATDGDVFKALREAWNLVDDTMRAHREHDTVETANAHAEACATAIYADLATAVCLPKLDRPGKSSTSAAPYVSSCRRRLADLHGRV